MIDDTVPRHYLESFPQRYKETLLKNTKLTKSQNDIVIKNLNWKIKM